MTKKEFLEILVKELERLEKEEHVSDLAKNGRYAEVDAVVAEIDYSALEEYMDAVYGEGDLSVETDIPESYVLTFAIYLSGSEYNECEVMESWKDLRDALRVCGDMGKVIADAISYHNINEFDMFEQLVKWDEDEEDEESDEDGGEDDEET